jgi:hypothetical protein
VSPIPEAYRIPLQSFLKKAGRIKKRAVRKPPFSMWGRKLKEVIFS